MLQLILTELDGEGFQRTFHEEEPLGDLQESELYAIETVRPSSASTPPSPGNPPQYQTQFLMLLIINKLISNNKAFRSVVHLPT